MPHLDAPSPPERGFWYRLALGMAWGLLLGGLFAFGWNYRMTKITEDCHRNERFFHNGMRYYCVAWPVDPVEVNPEQETST